MRKITTVASVAALVTVSMSASAWYPAPYGMTADQQKAMQEQQQAWMQQQTKAMEQMMEAQRKMAEEMAKNAPQGFDPMTAGYPTAAFPAMPEIPAPYGMNMPEFPAFGQTPDFPAMPEMPAPYGTDMPEFPAMPEMPAPYGMDMPMAHVPPHVQARYQAAQAQRAKAMEESKARYEKVVSEMNERRASAEAKRAARFAQPYMPYAVIAKAPVAEVPAPAAPEAAAPVEAAPSVEPAPVAETVAAPAVPAAPAQN